MNRFNYQRALRLKLLLVVLLCASMVRAQTINYAEYFFDTDPGVGLGTQITVGSDINDITVNENISTVGLNAGKHFLYLRTRSNSGVWSLSEPRAFLVKPQIVSAEYFVDADPDIGNGTAIVFSSDEDSVEVTFNTASLNLSPGKHYLFIRTIDDNGKWSLQEGKPFYVKQKIEAAEYFIDTDPGVGNGTSISFTATEDSLLFTGGLVMPILSTGNHQLFIRTRNDSGVWSMHESKSFFVKNSIVAAEYFFNADPGTGNGNELAIAADEDSISFLGNIVVPTLPVGANYLYIRTMDSNGQWSLSERSVFDIKNSIVEAEYFFNTDPGFGNGSSLAISSNEDSIAFIGNIVTPILPAGDNFMFIRTKDALGVWSLYEGRQFYVCADVLDASVITGDTVYCSGQTIALTGTAVTGATSYLWKGPGGYTQAGLVLSRSGANASMAGNYQLFAIRAGGTSCDSTASAVNIIIDPQFTVNNPAAVCLPQTINLTAGGIINGNVSGAELSYWQNAETTVLLNNPSAINASGTYYIKATWTSGCEYVLPVVVSVSVCGVPPANDNAQSNNPSLNATHYVYPNCYQIQGTTVNATVSSYTGERDVWYQFVAISNGISIRVNSGEINAKIFVFRSDNLNEIVDQEDVIDGTGTEVLNFDGLVAGVSYRIAVAALGTANGTFSLCLQQLRKPYCAQAPSGGYSLCSLFKSSATGASSTTVVFDDGSPTSITSSGPVTLSNPTLALLYGTGYDIALTANYELYDGAGNLENIAVDNSDACFITINPQPAIDVKSTQRCPAVLYRSTQLQGSPVGVGIVCGIIGYTVEFTNTSSCSDYVGNPLSTFTKTVNTSNATISLNNAFSAYPIASNPSIGYWIVRWRPTFQGNVFGNWGNPHIITVNGTAPSNNMMDDSDNPSGLNVNSSSASANVYPNPNFGEVVNLNLTGITAPNVFVRIVDGMGKVVYSNRYTVEGSLNTIVTFSNPLANGIYLVEFISGDDVTLQKMIVSK